jgi:hypothetical protein
MSDIHRMVQQLREALDVMVTGLSEAQARYVRAEKALAESRALLAEVLNTYVAYGECDTRTHIIGGMPNDIYARLHAAVDGRDDAE